MRAKCKSGADIRWRARAGGCAAASPSSGREVFGSRLGFVLSTAGAAIGLGNLWRFPWLVGMNGGGAFVLIYLTITLLVGIGLFMCEVSLGRATRRSSIGAFGEIRESWRPAGAVGPLASFFALCFYSVVGVGSYMLTLPWGLGADTGASAELFAPLRHPAAACFSWDLHRRQHLLHSPGQNPSYFIGHSVLLSHSKTIHHSRTFVLVSPHATQHRSSVRPTSHTAPPLSPTRYHTPNVHPPAPGNTFGFVLFFLVAASLPSRTWRR